MATYADGLVRDVTREAFIESGNIEIIEANTTGVLTTLRRGEAPVLVRYEGAYAATTIVCMGDRTGFAWEQKPQLNYIDQLVDQEAAGGEDPAQRPVHRRGIRPPRLSRPDRPAADRPASPRVPGRPRATAAPSATPSSISSSAAASTSSTGPTSGPTCCR